MKRFFHNFRFAMFGVSILCIALGAAVLLWPDYSQKVMCYGFGGILILSGLLQIVSYLTGDKMGSLRKLLVISGILSAVIGMWILLSPDKVMTLTVIVMGVVLIYHGAMDVKYGMDIKQCGTRGWELAMVFGLATCGVGILLLVNPFDDPAMLLTAAGLGFLFDGMTDIFTVFSVAHAKATYEKLASAAPVIELDPAKAEDVHVTGNTTQTPAVGAPKAGTEPKEDPTPVPEPPAEEETPPGETPEEIPAEEPVPETPAEETKEE